MPDLKIEKQASNISNFKVEVRNTEDTDFFSNLNKTNSNFKEVFEDGIKYDLNTLFENFNISFENDVKYWAVINKNKRKIIINFKQKNITVRDSTYVSSTENVKCMSGIKLHEDSKIYEDLTLDEILKSFIEDDRKNIEENRKYEEKKNNILIENRLKFENKLKELNITEEDFNLLVSLSKK